jgi:hypothetical protein
MPSLVDVLWLMMDGCVHLLYNNSWKFHQLAVGQLLSGQPVRYRKGRRYGPFITSKITPAGSLSSSQLGGPPCWAVPLAFSLIGYKHQSLIVSQRNLAAHKVQIKQVLYVLLSDTLWDDLILSLFSCPGQ